MASPSRERQSGATEGAVCAAAGKAAAKKRTPKTSLVFIHISFEEERRVRARARAGGRPRFGRARSEGACRGRRAEAGDQSRRRKAARGRRPTRPRPLRGKADG